MTLTITAPTKTDPIIEHLEHTKVLMDELGWNEGLYLCSVTGHVCLQGAWQLDHGWGGEDEFCDGWDHDAEHQLDDMVAVVSGHSHAESFNDLNSREDVFDLVDQLIARRESELADE